MTATLPATFFDCSGFLPDDCERLLPNVESAVRLQQELRPELATIMRDVVSSYLYRFGDQHLPAIRKTSDALTLSFARMAMRHGSWGGDFHAYHNENHAMELLNGRLARVRVQLGWSAFDSKDWLLLSLFCTCHDLRQRETPSFDRDVGANERASIAETHRILRICGFDPVDDLEFYQALEFMIAGSTFDARPEPPGAPLNSADAVSSGGSLSSALARDLELQYPNWQQSPELARRHRLMLVASDLDTANVGEPFHALTQSAVRLIREREMRAGRSLQNVAAGPSVLEFLTDGQERYFFKLHRFVSTIGMDVFASGKELNSQKLLKLTALMRAEFGEGYDVQPSDLIDRFEAIAKTL